MMTECSCSAGRFTGFASEGCIQYKGIRYASSERFCPPVPYTYGGVHECTTPAPYCPQREARIEGVLLGIDYAKVPWEESCQYLSVTVPEGTSPDSKLPVMVWYHGGAYKNGGCENYIYYRSKMSKEQNVIIVGVNYRLSVWGFVRDKEGNLANLGLLDSIEGLRWVKQNISAFGGDPDNITIFGQSAGADIVRCIILSEGTDDLFSKAIIQSAPFGAYTLTRKDMDRKVLEELNSVPADAPQDVILDAEGSILKHVTEESYAKEMVFGPHFGVFPLPEEEEIPKVLKERAPRHPILIGSNRKEVMAYVAGEKQLRRLWKLHIARGYIRKVSGRNTENIFRAPSRKYAELYSSYGGTVYHYDFRWMDGKYPGPCHGSELLMLFGADHFNGDRALMMGLTADDINATGSKMRDIWCGFARDGSVGTLSIEGVIDVERL